MVLSKANMGFAALHGSIGLLAKGVDKLTQSIESAFTKSIGFGDRAQKASLELGMTYREAQTKFAGSVEGLRGDLTTRYVGAFMALEAGLQGNTHGVTKLINQQMLTGTNYAKTAKTFARLEAIAGLDREATDHLTQKILVLNKTYSVSTEVLVDALDGLADVMPVAGMLGIGKQLTGAVAELAGIIGRDMLPELNKVVAEIMDVSIDKFGQRVMLGVDQTKQQLMASKSQTEDMRIMVNAIHTAADSVEMFAGGMSTLPEVLGYTQNFMGTNIMNFKLLSEELKKSNKKQAMGMTRFFETIETLKSEIFTPLFKVISEMFTPEVIQITQAFSAMGNALSKLLGEWLEKRMPKIMENLHKTIEGWIKASGPLIDMVVRKFKDIVTTMEPFIELFVKASGVLEKGLGLLNITDMIKRWDIGFDFNTLKRLISGDRGGSMGADLVDLGEGIRALAETEAERAAREPDNRTLGERISGDALKAFVTASEALNLDVERSRDTMAGAMFARATSDEFRELVGLTEEHIRATLRMVDEARSHTAGAIGSEAP